MASIIIVEDFTARQGFKDGLRTFADHLAHHFQTGTPEYGRYGAAALRMFGRIHGHKTWAVHIFSDNLQLIATEFRQT